MHVPDSIARDRIRHDSDIGFHVPFEELLKENNVNMDNMNHDACLPDNSEDDYDCKNFSFPDAHALLHVTDRKKIHSKKIGLLSVSIFFFSLCHFLAPVMWF